MYRLTRTIGPLALILLFFLVSSCSRDTASLSNTEQLQTDTTISFYKTIKPLIDNRCVVCHGCYDAPCQLKLSSAEGLLRGAHTESVYNGTRIFAASPTRLFIDAQSIEQWREKDFFPVLNPSLSNWQDNVFYRMLKLKSANPLPESAANNQPLPNQAFDFRLHRDNSCPSSDQFESYADEQRFGGMPYGLPGLTSIELNQIERWLAAGSPIETGKALSKPYQHRIAKWESFLNNGDLKTRLVARYIYEHLFIANLYFDDLPPGEYFKLVRSLTPPGRPIKLIATRRPFDSPVLASESETPQSIPRVYYRFQRVRDTIVAKNHIPYHLNEQRMKRFKELFFSPEYVVTELPGYDIELASNPFAVFSAIPTLSRYRFMIEQAQFTIMGFMKGTVCRGQVALNVINDHFWVFFIDPEHPVSEKINSALPDQTERLDLPAERSSNAGILAHWTEYSKAQAKYLKSKSGILGQVLQNNRPDLDWIWQGDDHNRNAALTVFRHFDSASVVKGLVGTAPKTAWLIDYPILERIHYLLVAGFDVYGNVGHQLSTRQYMDFLRMESEFNYLALLPEETKIQLKDDWYRDTNEETKNYVYGNYAYINIATRVSYPAEQPAEDTLYQLIHEHLNSVLSNEHLLEHNENTKLSRQLQPLNHIKGRPASLLSELGLLMITHENQPGALFTIARNSAHSNVSSLFSESENRIPEQDYLTIMPGIVGAYPDTLWRVEEEDLSLFVKSIKELRSEDDYAKLLSRFGVRRSYPNFWQHSDELHSLYRAIAPRRYGLLDYNRLENR